MGLLLCAITLPNLQKWIRVSPPSTSILFKMEIVCGREKMLPIRYVICVGFFLVKIYILLQTSYLEAAFLSLSCYEFPNSFNLLPNKIFWASSSLAEANNPAFKIKTQF